MQAKRAYTRDLRPIRRRRIEFNKNKRLQLTSHSVLQSTSGRVWHWNLCASAEPRRRCGSQLNRQSVGRRPERHP